MYTRLLKRPFELGQSFFLFGPRGTGKTTWLREHFKAKNTVYIDLLDSNLYAELLARPHRLETLVGAVDTEWVVLDEIQRVPELLHEVHRLIEGRGMHFAMTGSSARSLRRKGVNLLARRRLVAHPKFYFFDAGVYRSIRPMGPLDTPEEAEGAGLETLIFQELRAVNDALGLEYEIFYWRTSDGTEVDFVLYGPRGMLALEVKRSSRYTRSDLTGLRALKEDYPMAQCYLLYGGELPRQEDKVKVLPIKQFLPELAQILSSSSPLE